MTGNLGVPTPTVANHATTKAYVDSAITGVSVGFPLTAPTSTSPQYRTGGDDDSGLGGTGDGSAWLMANGFKKINATQNLVELLGGVTANSNVDIGGTLTPAGINLPAGSVDLTTDVTGILPFGNGGTGATGFGPTGSIPFNNGAELANDWANLNYSPESTRLTVPQVFQNVTLNSVTSGVTFESLRMQPTLSGTFNYFTGIGMGATLNGVTVSNAVQTFDFSNVFNGDNSSPNGVLDFNIHHDFRNNEGYVGGFKSLAFSNNFNDHDYVTLIDSNNVVGVTSNIANYKIFDMHDQVLAGATVNNYVALNHTITNSGGMGSYTGINDQPNFIVSPSSYIGINIAAQGGVTVSDPIALNLSSDNLYSSTALNRPKAIQHNGKGVFAFTSNTTLPNGHPSVVDSINNMISVVRTEPGSPLSGTGSLGWNFGGFIDAQANVSLDPIGAGINAAGWVSLVGISSGVTVAQAGGTISVPVNSTGASSGATGGHLSAFKHYQAFPFFTGGGSNTLGDNWGFSVPSGFCGGITGDCYGIHLGDTGAKSYLAGPVTLGLASDTVPYLDGATTLVSSSVSGTELGYLNGVTASLQTQINAIMSTNSSQDAAIAALQGTLETVALSGASTLISNTTITANSYPFMLSQGADVSPYLIGLSAGVGYSVGASGAGTVKVFILEGQ